MVPHPDFPRYPSLRGEPTLLISCAEHYGSLLNRAFDFRRYLAALERRGFNQSRVFSGTYREIPGDFGIEDNVLAPREEDFLCPWARTPGGRFDLDAWNEEYWARLRDLLGEADRRGVALEIVLFCFWYSDHNWTASPMHPDRTVQGVGPRRKEEVYAEDTPLWPWMERFVRRMVEEVGPFELPYFEIVNEPYSRHDGGLDLPFQHRVVELIRAVEAERGLPRRAVAINYENRTVRLKYVHPGVDVVNLHYALPEGAYLNLHHDRILALDETGFAGQMPTHHRIEAWRWVMSGGSVVSHLDYGYTVADPEGGAELRGESPSYAGEDLRSQYAALARFGREFRPWEAEIANERFGWEIPGHSAQVLATEERVALYLSGPGRSLRLTLALEAGAWRAMFRVPATLRVVREEGFEHPGGWREFGTPLFAEDLLLEVRRG